MSEPNLTTCAVCGLFCEACSLYLGSTQDPARLQFSAKRFGKPLDQVECHGCRSDVVCWHCHNCKLRSCAQGKGLEFCADCSEFPCAEYRAFARGELEDPLLSGDMPHRLELMQDCRRIQEKGWRAWSAEKTADYSCPSCGAMNSPYDLKCRKCAHEPGNRFVSRHKDSILRAFARSK